MPSRKSASAAPVTEKCSRISCPAGGGNELFDAIQDPVLVVTPDGVIIDANLAAINAARKTKDQIIGMGICQRFPIWQNLSLADRNI